MNNQIVVLALVVICGSLSVSGSPAIAHIKSKVDDAMMNYMMQPRAGPSGVVCFNNHNQAVEAIIRKYEEDYEKCLSDANDKISELLDVGKESREDITETTNEVCAKFSACQAGEDNLEFFDCYSKLRAESVKPVYTATSDAGVSAANYREKYREIEAEQNRCTAETERKYVASSANAYDDLMDCLANGPKPTAAPITEPTTPQPTTPEPTTAEPTTSEPTTSEPTTPEPTTPEPTTPEPTTPEPTNPEPTTLEPTTPEPTTPKPVTTDPETRDHIQNEELELPNLAIL